jgi:hypothetical protein
MRQTLLFVLALFALLPCSCIRTSTVVRVKRDGSGSIVSRYHFSPEMLAMLDQLEALGGAFGDALAAGGGVGGGPDLGLIRELAKPDEESLRADADGFGEGVRYAKHELTKDDGGWEGYAVVYEFDDIRGVRIDQNSMPGKAKELVKSAGEELKASEGGSLAFALEGDVLTVTTSFAKDGMEGLLDKEQIEQARAMGVPPSEAVKMAAGVTEGMRIGTFLRAEGGIAETDAEHVSGDLIVISDVDLPKLMLDPDFGAFMDKVAANPEAATPEALRELSGKLEAMTVETKESFTVKLK